MIISFPSSRQTIQEMSLPFHVMMIQFFTICWYQSNTFVFLYYTCISSPTYRYLIPSGLVWFFIVCFLFCVLFWFAFLLFAFMLAGISHREVSSD